MKVMKRASSDKRKGLPLKVEVYYCEDFVAMNRKEKKLFSVIGFNYCIMQR